MEWIIEAEDLTELMEGRFTLSTKPLIRCKDCRHYYEEHSNIWKEPLCSCRKWLCSHPTLPEGFCNYVEAKG